ncbi:MAG: hypothetical protein IPQ23_22310 [Cytophagaceae bacterium]|nr:hypothetical protein [Cytophagaceae bacterium]
MKKRAKDRKTAIIFIRATREQRSELRELAKRLGVSEAECVRNALSHLAAIHCQPEAA